MNFHLDKKIRRKMINTSIAFVLNVEVKMMMVKKINWNCKESDI